ncbi:MAG: hypothetical protein EBQ97_00275 [Bacteroidetes bacterium]|nr:hypothetical protein [Bacteroidota bacterium]
MTQSYNLSQLANNLNTAGQLDATDGLVGAVPAANGGTGLASYTIGDILYASASTTLAKLADVATGNALISGGVGVAPSWGKIALTTHVSGTLAIGNGGTGTTSYGTNNLVIASGTSAFTGLAPGSTIGAIVRSTGSTFSVGGSAATARSAVTFSATVMIIDCSLSNVFTTTFTANVTTAPTFSNVADGQTINWFITQDGTGSRTMTWPTSFKWPGGTAGALSTAANAVDLLVATYRSDTGFWYATIAKAFA